MEIEQALGFFCAGLMGGALVVLLCLVIGTKDSDD